MPGNPFLPTSQYLTQHANLFLAATFSNHSYQNYSRIHYHHT